MIAMDIPPAIIAPAVVEVRVPTVRGDVIDSERMIACLLQVEGNRWTDPGGGLGWTRAAWMEDSELTFRHAQLKEHAFPAAKARIARFIAECAEIGLQATPIAVADMWRRGFFFAINRLKNQHRFGPMEYAKRCENLYYDKEFRP